MGSLDIDFIRKQYPGKSDSEAAKSLAEKHGYLAVVGYKRSSSDDGFSNFGTCSNESEIRGYLTSPYCHGTKVLFDARSSVFHLSAEHVLKGKCASCGRPSTRESLQMGAGNDFYFCPKCGKLFCDNCYPRLPLTASPGYGTCSSCRVEVKRTLPSFFIS